MPPDITRLELRLRRRSAIGYAAGMALYTLAVVALYPSFKSSTSLDSLSGSTAAAVFGLTGQLTSPGGWLNGNIYGNFFPLIMLLLTIGYGAVCLAGQDEDGTLALTAALPIRRWAIVLQKAWAMALQALLLAAVVTVCVLIGRGFQLTVGPGDAFAVAAALTLLGLDFGLITMAAGAATGRRGTALGIGTGLAAASYLLCACVDRDRAGLRRRAEPGGRRGPGRGGPDGADPRRGAAAHPGAGRRVRALRGRAQAVGAWRMVTAGLMPMECKRS